MIKRASDKTSDLNPVPTWLVQELAPFFLYRPFFAHVFNVSLENGYFPASQKKAFVYPGRKKPWLDPDDLANCRRFRNLSFVSCLSGLFMLSCFIISKTVNCCLQFNPLIGSFFDQNYTVLKVVTRPTSLLSRWSVRVEQTTDYRP